MSDFFKLDRNIQLRMVIMFITIAIGSSVGPNMTIYYVAYFGAGITGILLVFVQVAGFIAGLYGGHLADVWGRKRVMLSGIAAMAVGYTIAATMNSPMYINPYVTFLGFLLATVGMSFASPAEEAMMIDVSTLKNRKFIYAMMYWVINFSVMIGAALGGWFFKTARFELLIGTAIGAIISLIIVMIWVTETFQKEKRQNTGQSVLDVLKSYRTIFSDQRYLKFMVAGVGAVVVFSSPDYYLAAHLAETFHSVTVLGIQIFGQRMLSVITIVNTVMIVLLMGTMTKLFSNWSNLKASLVGIAIQGGSFALMLLLNDFWPLFIVAIVLTIGEMIVTPANQSLRAEMMNQNKVGVYSGFSAATRPLGYILSSGIVSISIVIGHIGAAILLLVATGVSMWFTYLAVVMLRENRTK
ncbi:MFS transporter [uncultured Leuconostoc sp.]|uniref:MFS transporter n=1 Tax=uncultured Leuconostoc sp. TaxID=173262 RepID=UPI0025FD9C29|nr:MFS transporter [uncultured Leuconostoc sp.]